MTSSITCAGTELVAILRADQTLAPDFFLRTLAALELADVRLAQGRLVYPDLPAAADVFDVVRRSDCCLAYSMGLGRAFALGSESCWQAGLAPQPSSAIQAVERPMPDVAVSDLVLPPMDAIRTARQLWRTCDASSGGWECYHPALTG